jgi:hypothetical protein
MEKTIALFVLASLFLFILFFMHKKNDEVKEADIIPQLVSMKVVTESEVSPRGGTAVNGAMSGETIIREDKNKNSGGDGGGNGKRNMEGWGGDQSNGGIGTGVVY